MIFYSNRNMDIRDAILQLLNVIREGNKKLIQVYHFGPYYYMLYY